MAVNAIGGSVGSGSGGTIQPQGLSIQDFLQLFLSQLQFQDPLKPIDNTEFLAQLAQFTNIEQTQVMSDNVSGELTIDSVNQAVGLLGRQVQFTDANNATQSGVVDQVNFSNGQPSLIVTVNSSPTSVSLSQLTQVGIATSAPTGSH